MAAHVFRAPKLDEVAPTRSFTHPPRFLLLYGSLKQGLHGKARKAFRSKCKQGRS